jgi:hypothetical protein
MDLSCCAEEDLAALDDCERAALETVGPAVLTYIKSAADLLARKYSHVRELAPAYLRSPGKVLVGFCRDGLVMRFESKGEKPEVCAGWSTESFSDLVSKLSQDLVHCHIGSMPETLPTGGMQITIFRESPGGAREDIGAIRVGFDAVIRLPDSPHVPPSKPFCLFSVRNELDLLMHLRPVQQIQTREEVVVVRNTIRLPVGWDCIEAYPGFDPAQWKQEYAAMWAENDILAAVVAHQSREAQYQSLDPNAAARDEFGKLLARYKELLDSDPAREEILQVFLDEHPALLCPAHKNKWPKLALGPWKTDFVFREAAGDYILVELERSTHKLFRRDGDASSELNHAKGQITNWKRYLEDNLSTVKRELGLSDISVNPRSIIVIGRSASLTEECHRKLVTIENEIPKLKIMTYDDVYSNAKAVIENLLGPLSVMGGSTRVYYLPGR